MTAYYVILFHTHTNGKTKKWVYRMPQKFRFGTLLFHRSHFQDGGKSNFKFDMPPLKLLLGTENDHISPR